jgi:anti-sigma factor RsiW
MHLDHFRYRRYVDAFVDGELGGTLRGRVERHIAQCPACEGDVEVTVHVKDSLARVGHGTVRVIRSGRRWFGIERG